MIIDSYCHNLLELRRRNVAGAAPSPGGTLQKAVSVPSLTGSLPPSPQRRSDPEPSTSPGPGTPQRANSMSNISGSIGRKDIIFYCT